MNETDSLAGHAVSEDTDIQDDIVERSAQPRVKKARTSSNNRKQKYRDEWETKPEFSEWLSRAKDDPHGAEAFCKVCRCKIQARMATIRVHAKSSKHVSLMTTSSGTSKLSKFFKSPSTVPDETKKAELKMCAFIAEHNLSFRLMDHLSDLISSTFYDSAIARAFSCKRTKSASMTYNVLAQGFKTELRKDIQSTSRDGHKKVSLIIDETTDKGTVKCMAIVIKFFSDRLMKVDTRLLNLIPVIGETAADLFETLNSDLNKHGLEMSDVIGFAADTTNVIFGQNNSIVSRIIEANPHCFTMKCTCHSCALAVSHACATLPRNLEQVVRETYNYFALSSKRCNEFKEFQDFTNSQHYRMLRFYSIRWLSFGSCIERILSQWNPLKLYFTSQYLVDRLQTSLFLYQQFSDNITKLYFAFLSYIIPVVNKLNVIFQCESPAIHKLHSDCISAYKVILSCFIKPILLKGDVSSIDPTNPSNHLPLAQLYMGVEAARLMASVSFKGVAKEKVTECLQRCKDFLSHLCCQLKMRLPLNNPVIQDLKFLDPQKAVSGSIASIANVAARFPNIVPTEELQSLDQEWRQLIVDEEISELADSCATLPIEIFWVKVSSNDNYKLLGAFAKTMLSLPVSNVDCERVFSQVNLIKTTHRNRFSTEGVASLIFVKDGIKHTSESCVKFEPTREMLQKCNETIYTNVEAIYGDDPDT